MIFTVGVGTPDNENQAYGMIVPVLCQLNYGCFSAADEVEDLLPMVTEAIHLNLQSMVEDNIDITTIQDKGYHHYKNNPEYADFDSWLLVDIDITEYLKGKETFTVEMPPFLLERIDQAVKKLPNRYQNRNQFLASATHKELMFIAGLL